MGSIDQQHDGAGDRHGGTEHAADLSLRLEWSGEHDGDENDGDGSESTQRVLLDRATIF